MIEVVSFYTLVHMDDLLFVDTTGESYTQDIMEAIRFGDFEGAKDYREIFDFPEAFEIYEVDFSYSLRRSGGIENAGNE